MQSGPDCRPLEISEGVPCVSGTSAKEEIGKLHSMLPEVISSLHSRKQEMWPGIVMLCGHFFMECWGKSTQVLSNES